MKIGRLRTAWARFRQRFWWSLAFDVLALVALFYAIHSWQTRNLPLDLPAPNSVLAQLNKDQSIPLVEQGTKGVIYFFAPWCSYCRYSIGNLDALLEGEQVAWARAVALDYENIGEVNEFVESVGLNAPVLLGGTQQASDWHIRAFPTYYVINSDGRISSRSVGYSTRLGLFWRAWRAR